MAASAPKPWKYVLQPAVYEHPPRSLFERLKRHVYTAGEGEFAALSRPQADARLAQVVEMRYFGGLGEAEIAEMYAGVKAILASETLLMKVISGELSEIRERYGDELPGRWIIGVSWACTVVFALAAVPALMAVPSRAFGFRAEPMGPT